MFFFQVNRLMNVVKKILEKYLILHDLQQYADPTDEPASQPYDQTFEDFDLSVEEWKGNCMIFTRFCIMHLIYKVLEFIALAIREIFF